VKTKIANTSSFNFFATQEAKCYTKDQRLCNYLIETHTIESVVCSYIDNWFSELNRTSHDGSTVVILSAACFKSTTIDPLYAAIQPYKLRESWRLTKRTGNFEEAVVPAGTMTSRVRPGEERCKHCEEMKWLCAQSSCPCEAGPLANNPPSPPGIAAMMLLNAAELVLVC
jgi:hypothetical protein